MHSSFYYPFKIQQFCIYSWKHKISIKFVSVLIAIKAMNDKSGNFAKPYNTFKINSIFYRKWQNEILNALNMQTSNITCLQKICLYTRGIMRIFMPRYNETNHPRISKSISIVKHISSWKRNSHLNTFDFTNAIFHRNFWNANHVS